ncbi:hypothetical protein C0995_009093 [Termitomyces sp. Mi166|nr:hypothetical protein C0995_009093 [Termitomyces sp. Mi166\
MFKEPMVEPKQARALSQRPQELAWAPVHTIAWLPPRLMKLEPDILAEPLAELLLEASDQIMSNAPAVQQEQRSKAPQVPAASSSKAGASSQEGA